MFRIVLPSLSNTLISLFKDTSLGAAIAVPELTYAAQRAIGETYSAIEPLVVSGLLYWVLNDLVVAAGRRLERRFTRHVV